MKLTIFAATGGTGRNLLEQAVDAGHQVTAVVRTPANLSREVRLVTDGQAIGQPVGVGH
jgi:putative NADH-flavin reductase